VRKQKWPSVYNSWRWNKRVYPGRFPTRRLRRKGKAAAGRSHRNRNGSKEVWHRQLIQLLFAHHKWIFLASLGLQKNLQKLKKQHQKLSGKRHLSTAWSRLKASISRK